ncbi:hypothetical protein GALMADRAFT_68391 [Galerina marginata CBS 339.88]|uniref:Uncharacterized protein n=1 Tax=Galerina marginata (strain CBS 339.88) TaxID=685588 RepID=A0A067SXM9_GALM3|nr:hypothetical protein GALMADRAFT_68391 [Galerina marginata CBS 339.88]
MTNKLKLKRTPEEEAQHRLRKGRRKEKRKRKEEDYYGSTSKSKRAHVDDYTDSPQRKWASSDEDEMEFGPQPAPSSSSTKIPPHGHKPDHDALHAEIEDQLFREKMFDALGDDERLDGVEARFNDFAGVPDRWRTSKAGLDGAGKGKQRANFYDDEGDELLKLDPRNMDDEEYAEWIRAGMYKKTHAEEYAEKQRKKVAQTARRAEEKARKAEAARLEKAAEEERKRRKVEREERRMDYAREEYNTRWTELLAAQSGGGLLRFDDVPWPIGSAHRHKRRPTKDDEGAEAGLAGTSGRATNVEDLTAEAISSFLLLASRVVGPDSTRKKERKDKLRVTLLRFHPDKFEGRFMGRFEKAEWERVREAIGQVSRVLNSLMDGD